MSRQDLILFSAIYALIIAAGHSGPILKKLSQLHWAPPVRSRSPASSQWEWAFRVWAAERRFWAGQRGLFGTIAGAFAPPEEPLARGGKTGPQPGTAPGSRTVRVPLALHPLLHHVRPWARARRTPVPGARGTEHWIQEGGTKG